jgi:hypothetical protein
MEICVLDLPRSGKAMGRWFYLGTAVSSSNKTDRHDISEILLKVAVKYYTSHTALLHQYTNTRIIHLTEIYIFLLSLLKSIELWLTMNSTAYQDVSLMI